MVNNGLGLLRHLLSGCIFRPSYRSADGDRGALTGPVWVLHITQNYRCTDQIFVAHLSSPVFGNLQLLMQILADSHFSYRTIINSGQSVPFFYISRTVWKSSHCKT
ncbi:hypothetical protein GOODEAATRI_029679 [Goodea atripinnis]|uniref:Uncharacterized protein n=1 Tax=Goodea atripinnis TaxID=208336 RepID=A0ABV0PI26_9TELE